MKANIYQNDVEDYIELVTFGPPRCIVPNPSPVGPPCFAYNDYSLAQYQNVEEARLRGFEFEGTYDARKWFFSLAGQITEGEVTAGEDKGQPLSTIPPDQVTTTLGARFLDEKLTVAVRWTAVAAKTAADLPDDAVYEPTDSFNLVSIYAGYQPLAQHAVAALGREPARRAIHPVPELPAERRPDGEGRADHPLRRRQPLAASRWRRPLDHDPKWGERPS